MRMRQIVICGLVRLCNIFPHYIIHGTIFEKKNIIEQKICVWFSLQLFSEKFLILIRSVGYMIMNVHFSSCKVRIILVRFQQTFNFLTGFRKILKNKISWKFVQWEQWCSMRAGGQTDRHKKANSRFLQFWKVPKLHTHFHNFRWKIQPRLPFRFQTKVLPTSLSPITFPSSDVKFLSIFHINNK